MRKISFSKRSLQRIFTMLTVWYPMIAVYFVNIAGIRLSMADMLLLALVPILTCRLFADRCVKLEPDLFLLFLFCSLHFYYAVLMDYRGLGLSVSDTGHFLLVLLVLAVFCPNFLDKDQAYRNLTAAAAVSSVYLTGQFVLLKAFGVYIPGQLPFLETATAVSGHIRPFSFFSEPAAFGWYNSIGLAAVLFQKEMPEKKRALYAAVISAALFISTSTTSLGLMAAVWSVWILQRFRKRAALAAAVFIIAVPVLAAAESRYGILSTVYSHSVTGLLQGNFAAGIRHRVGGYEYAFSYHKGASLIRQLFGSGIVETGGLGIFIPTLGKIFMYYGISGYFIFALFFIRKYRASSVYGRTLLLLALVSSFFAESLFGIMMLWYMPHVNTCLKKEERP